MVSKSNYFQVSCVITLTNVLATLRQEAIISPLATEAKIELLIKNVYSIQTQIIHNRTNYSTGPKQDQNTNQSFRNRYGPS